MPDKPKDDQDEEPTLDHLGNMMGALLKVPKREVQKPKDGESTKDGE